ncbi:uncharacterized protein BKA78DRAFT_43838 [Phyllosticta capitalensis]|uniref:uncharacterized protein n=1 Tax=Phyllosticta capitalensis TaxID=121624 RepID=UPI003130F1D2
METREMATAATMKQLRTSRATATTEGEKSKEWWIMRLPACLTPNSSMLQVARCGQLAGWRITQISIAWGTVRPHRRPSSLDAGTKPETAVGASSRLRWTLIQLVSAKLHTRFEAPNRPAFVVELPRAFHRNPCFELPQLSLHVPTLPHGDTSFESTFDLF